MPARQHARAGTATSTCTNALAVSSDAFFYHLGEEFFLTPGEQLQDQLKLFGFGSKTGIDLPFEFGGRVPTNELKQQLVDKGVLAKGEVPKMQPGDVLLLAIGQGLLAATPLQLAVGYSAFANGGTIVTPHVVQAILAPETPDSGIPGVADRRQATVVQQITPAGRPIPMPPEVHDPIQNGIRRNITGGPAIGSHSTTAEELFADYPADAIPVAGKTGTAQGRGSYPWNDSSAFTAYSIDPARPYTVTSYLEKAGYGSVGAAPVVKCMFEALSGVLPIDPVVLAEPLDTTSDKAAKDLPKVARRLHGEHERQHDHPGRGHGRQGLTTGWASRCCSASRTPVSATSAPARPTPAATSTGCCCWPSSCSPSPAASSCSRRPARAPPTRTRSSPAR